MESNTLSPAEKKLQQTAKWYVNFEVEGKKVPIPYILGYGRWQFHRTSGKGSPQAIRDEVVTIARQKNFDLKRASEKEIYFFLKQNKIGIDCSGLAFHLLDAYTRERLQKPLATFLLRKPGIIGKIEKNVLSFQRHRRISAATLTSDLNSFTIPATKDIQIADLIRIHQDEDHVLIVTSVTKDEEGEVAEITYIHSSHLKTRKQGPHYGTIQVHNPTLGLEAQQWLELTKAKRSYGETIFNPTLGDSIRRLKIFA